MKAKVYHKERLLNYLGNPENEFPNRVYMNDHILGFKGKQYIYKLFTLDELHEIETEALVLRRRKYSPEIAKADKALFKQAINGDVAAIKLCYQRFEDWSEKQRKELTGVDGKNLDWKIEIIKPEVE